jgi:iron(III) transport system permease protein
MSSLFVCFTLCFTDFGAPKVVGGNYNVLATEIYKQVIGQQNFGMGATVSIVLLIPTALAFLLDRIIQRRQTAWITSKTVPITPKPSSLIDRILFVFCILVSGAILSTILTVLMASLVKVWPYTLTLGWHHYDFSVTGGGGYGAYWNSIRMSAYTAVLGSALTFTSAYLLEKTKEMPFLRHATYFISLLPLALPGLVIGLAYIFFFNAPRVSLPFLSSSFLNPFHVFYGTMTILVICNVVHFYSVCFLTAIAALKQLDREFEMVSASMTVPFYKTFWRVTVPVCLPAVLEIGFYYFVNSMATVSAVIFLYSPDIKLASVAAMNMDDAGDTAAAAAMCFLIMVTNILSRVFYDLASRRLLFRSQAWREKSNNG